MIHNHIKNSLFLFGLILLFSCKTKVKEETATVQADTATTEIALQPVNKKVNDTVKIILKTNSIPGDINANSVKQLPENLKALVAFYAAMGGSNCFGDSCELTTALGLGKQGSEEHKALITKYFPNDSVAKLVVSQDCYLRPSGASSFSDYQYLTLVNLGDTVKVDYNLMTYDGGKSTFQSGPDIYLFADNKFTKLKRNIWTFANK